MNDFLNGLISGVALSLVIGVFVATSDDITGEQIKASVEICGGWEKITYFDTDGEDTVVCLDGKEWGLTPFNSFNNIFTELEERKE